MTDRLCQHYSAEEFEDMLARAERFAETPREREFVENVRDRYAHYGDQMFVSDRQLDWLYNIASYR